MYYKVNQCYSLNIKGNLLELKRPLVMGILNVTPDSFYAGSRNYEEDKIVSRIHRIIDEGADIIDIGGYSSRPFAENISAEEEMCRLSHGLKIITKEVPDAIVSVDTFRADVAKYCVEEHGVSIINDISGGDLDNRMYEVVADLKVPYILMHMRGNPDTMTSLTDYTDVVADVIKDLGKKCARLIDAGVNDIIIDPGFGFSKTVEQNYKLLGAIGEFKNMGFPVLAGVSRKSMIYRSLGITPEDALNGTTVLNTIALVNGADILRVHDVKEAVEAVKLVGLTYPKL